MQAVKQPFPDRTPRYAGKMLDGPERSRMRKALLSAGQKTMNMTDQQIIGAFRMLNPYDNLSKFLPEPAPSKKRGMVAVDLESFAIITQLAEDLDTTKGNVVRALTQHYMADK